MARQLVTERRASAPSRLLLLLFLAVASVLAYTPSRAEAQIGCCYCDNCPPQSGPLCTDLMNSSASCVDLCIVQRGCGVLEFSPEETCAGGCGSKPPFFSPTPTATPTLTTSPTPTISATPTITPTATNTATPMYCCQNVNYCRTADSPNVPFCPNAQGTPIETPILNASCDGGANQCKTFTPTNTPTNTFPTFTRTPTVTQTPTRTGTPTPTPTITIGGFMLNPFSCYRVNSDKASAAKNIEYTVEDEFGVRQKKILKPRYICAPSDVEFDEVATPIPNKDKFLFCYKIKDIPKAAAVSVTVRNALDDGLAVQTIKGELLCLPSYAILPPTKTPPPVTATQTPSRTPTS